ncbi:hypothetical protein QR680_008368 [Steinernema hermaphroditum]|uniref:Insulin-like domain-containing protein n=1 Tax=Steinernema hermaphroditum TaxID=289476 RepID=A0AA39IIM3_9BILA|nr:hypothetical protein QR680_008368 [Steinernema hermaphroditum]
MPEDAVVSKRNDNAVCARASGTSRPRLPQTLSYQGHRIVDNGTAQRRYTEMKPLTALLLISTCSIIFALEQPSRESDEEKAIRLKYCKEALLKTVKRVCRESFHLENDPIDGSKLIDESLMGNLMAICCEHSCSFDQMITFCQGRKYHK